MPIDSPSLETVPCLLCGGSATDRSLPTRDRLCGVAGEFLLRRCANCGLLYLSPRPTPESMDAYYPPEYDPFAVGPLAEMPHWLAGAVRYGMYKRRRLVTQHVSGGQLLDVGCGAGHFVDEMRRAPRWQARGVEPSAGAAQAARDRGLDVFPGDLAAARFPDGAFDAVTMWDVVEHLHDPRTVLAEIRRILRPDGALILRTPSVDSLDAHVFGSHWAGLDSPRHIAVFSRRTLARLLTAAGFRLDSLATGSGSFGVWHLSLRFLLDERIRRPGLRRIVLRATGSPLARAVTLPAFYVVDRLGRGSELLAVARPVPGAGEREAR